MTPEHAAWLRLLAWASGAEAALPELPAPPSVAGAWELDDVRAAVTDLRRRAARELEGADA